MQYRRYEVQWLTRDRMATGIEIVIVHEGMEVDDFFEDMTEEEYDDLESRGDLFAEEIDGSSDDSSWESAALRLVWERIPPNIGQSLDGGGVGSTKTTLLDRWEA